MEVTNIPNFVAKGWWTMYSNSANSVYFTNYSGTPVLTNSLVTWKDFTTNGWDLTNSYTSADTINISAGLETPFPQRQVGAFHSKDTLRWGASGAATFLRTHRFTNSQPSLIFMLINPTIAIDGTTRTMSDNSGTAPRQLWRVSTDKHQLNAGSTITGYQPRTQAWQTITCVFSNTASGYWTNFTSVTNGTAGTAAQNGLTLLAGNVLSGNFNSDVAEVVAGELPQSFTAPQLTAVISNINWCVTNRWSESGIR